MIFQNDKKCQESALLAFASISLKKNSPNIDKFYETKLISKLFEMIRDHTIQASYYALDSIR